MSSPTSRPPTSRPSRARIGLGILGLGVLVWIVIITITILSASPDGEPDVGRLAESSQEALTTRDADALARLLDYPHSDVDDFASDYLATIDRETRGPIRVVAAPGDRLEISGLRADGGPFSYLVTATRNDDDRWVLSFAPPV